MRLFKRKNSDPPIVYAIALVDMYSNGTVYRAGIDLIQTTDPIYVNAPHAFEIVGE